MNDLVGKLVNGLNHDKGIESLLQLKFIILISLQPDGAHLRYFKISLFVDPT